MEKKYRVLAKQIAPILWLISCCLILLLGCQPQINRVHLISATVTRVISGQTIEVKLAEDSTIARVRIAGIDAPDLRQHPWGKIAQDKLIQLVMGLPVELEIENSSDRYNRISAHVWQGKTLVSQELIASGCVLANTKYPHSYSKLLKYTQEYARLLGYGIWNPQQALRHTPNQFRLQIK